MAEVFFSIGTDTSDFNTGEWVDPPVPATVTISGNTATFSASITTNIGVGDVIEYNGTTNQAYIAGKTTQGTWTVTNVTGGVPTAITTGACTIKRVFSSIVDALNEYTGINNGLYGLISTRNLVSAALSVNIACYDDDIDVTTEGCYIGYGTTYAWTCSSTYFIRVFTPFDTATECNQNQRHDGTEDGPGYTVKFTWATGWRSLFYTVYIGWFVIDGLRLVVPAKQIDYIQTVFYADNRRGPNTTISNCVLIPSATAYAVYLYENGYSGYNNPSSDRFFNNIILGSHGGRTGVQSLNYYQDAADKETWIYNNTAYGNFKDYALYYRADTNGTPPGIHPTYGTKIKNNVFANTRSKSLFGASSDISGDVVQVGFTNNAAHAKSRSSGLIVRQYWKCNTGSGSTIFDVGGILSISLISGTWSTGVTGAAGDYSVGFNGTSDYAQIPHSSSLNKADCSISAWVKVTGGAGTTRSIICSRYNDDSTNTSGGGWELEANSSDKFTFKTGTHPYYTGYTTNFPTAVGTTTIVLGQWYHVVGTKPYQGQSKIYVNGVLEGTSSTSTGYNYMYANSTMPTRIGAGTTWTTPGAWFPGEVDEIFHSSEEWDATYVTSLYNSGTPLDVSLTVFPVNDCIYVLDIADFKFKSIPPLGINPVGYWRFNDGSASTLSDEQGSRWRSDYPGTINGATWVDSGGVTAATGDHALSFNGSSNYVDCGDCPWYTGLYYYSYYAYWYPDFTWSAWVYLNNNSDQMFIMHGSGANGNGAYMNLYQDKLTISVGQNGSGTFQAWAGVGDLGTGAWHHIAAVASFRAKMKVYIDGVDKTDAAVTDLVDHVYVPSTNNFCLGGYSGSSQWLNGKMDEVAVFPNVLSSAQIVQLYNGGTPLNVFKTIDLSLTKGSVLKGTGVGPSVDTEVPIEDVHRDLRAGASSDMGSDEAMFSLGFEPLPPFTSTIGIFKSIFP